MRMVLMLTAIVAAGCATLQAGAAARERLTSTEMDDFRACAEPMTQMQCGAQSQTAVDDVFGRMLAGESGGDAVCLNGLMARYAEAHDKRRWLMRNGCPRDVVYAYENSGE